MLDLGVGVLSLEEGVESRDDLAVDVVGPETCVGAGLGVPGEKREGIGVQVFELYV